MQLDFYKYQGAGNDFVIIDDREGLFDVGNHKLVKFLCDRRFGVGADGLMLLRQLEGYDFEMVYFNSDGYEGSMCGNGGRCIVAFASDLGLIHNHCRFLAVDGEHEADVISFNGSKGVSLKMIDVAEIEKTDSYCYMNTGSPHYVQIVSDLENFKVYEEGKKIRNNERFKEEGTNVNFIEQIGENELAIRTYERGVENETLACGTGVTAAVICSSIQKITTSNTVKVNALGGVLQVLFKEFNGLYSNVWLQGPAEFVFKGSINV